MAFQDKRKPNWQIHLEEKINIIRRKISFIKLITNSQNDSAELTKHQVTIKAKLKRWYGNTKRHALMSKLSHLKHELKVTRKSLRKRKKLTKRNSINSLFQLNQKQIFWNWKSKKITVEKEPPNMKLRVFGLEHGKKPTAYNKDAQWLKTVENEYCKGAAIKDYLMDNNTFENFLHKMRNNVYE